MAARALAGLALLALPAPAGAATVTLEYEPPIEFVEPDPAYTLAVEAGTGEANRLQVALDRDGFLVRDRGRARLSAGKRCSPAGTELVRCALPRRAGHRSVFVDAGDRNDVVALGPLPGVELAEVLAGRGDDAVVGHGGADLLYGGSGRDWLGGLAGGDRFDGGPGDDILDGGEGRDLVTYASRRAGVVVDLAAGTGGPAGERDRLVSVEDAAGGRGADRLYGDARENYLFGGGEGRDVADGRAGDDRINARRAVGGPGDDGLDTAFADCGAGRDVASRFSYQSPGGYGAGCERIAGYYYLITRPRRVRAGLRLILSCPIRRCRGEFAVSDRRGRLAQRRYDLRGEAFGGPGPRVMTLAFRRRPAGGRGRFEITVESLRRDRFSVGLR